MAPHSSVLAWRIPGTGEPGGLPSVGSHSQTQLKRLSSSRDGFYLVTFPLCIVYTLFLFYVFIFGRAGLLLLWAGFL